MTTSRGVVINVHLHGATVRLDDGSLASVPFAELAAHRPVYVASFQKRTPLDLALELAGRHRVAFLGGTSRPARASLPATESPDDEAGSLDDDDLGDGEIVRTLRLVDGTPAPVLNDPIFEHRIAAYLKSTEAWAPADRPAPDERNQLRKKKRAAFFESRPQRQPPA